jgi:hypothetical protein
MGNRLQWMVSFFWLGLVSNRAVLFEDDPQHKVLVLSDFLESKHIDWNWRPQIVTQMQEGGVAPPVRREKDIEQLFWADDKRTTRKVCN